jgi:hypothetical protein
MGFREEKITPVNFSGTEDIFCWELFCSYELRWIGSTSGKEILELIVGLARGLTWD